MLPGDLNADLIQTDKWAILPLPNHARTRASSLFTAYFPNATFVSVYTKDWSHQLWNIVQMGFTPEWVAAGGDGPIFTFIFVGQIWRSPACLFHQAGLAQKRWGKITPSNTLGELYGHFWLLSPSLAQIWPSDIAVLIGTCPKWRTWCELMVLRTRNRRRVCDVHESVDNLICHVMIQKGAYDHSLCALLMRFFAKEKTMQTLDN